MTVQLGLQVWAAILLVASGACPDSDDLYTSHSECAGKYETISEAELEDCKDVICSIIPEGKFARANASSMVVARDNRGGCSLLLWDGFGTAVFVCKNYTEQAPISTPEAPSSGSPQKKFLFIFGVAGCSFLLLLGVWFITKQARQTGLKEYSYTTGKRRKAEIMETLNVNRSPGTEGTDPESCETRTPPNVYVHPAHPYTRQVAEEAE